MRTVRTVSTRQVVGVTVGLRKDGSVAVLFDDNQISWYKSEEFAATFEVI
jgi:hypothetical protein